MRKLLSCRFDIDTTLPMRTEMDWLIYNDSLEHAQIVLEDQELNQRGKAAFCGLPSFSLQNQMLAHDIGLHVFAQPCLFQNSSRSLIFPSRTSLDAMPPGVRLKWSHNLYQQQAAAKEEVGRPFPYEDELREKSARLTELDTLLNIDSKAPSQQETIVAKSTRPSVLEGLRRPMPPRAADKKSKTHEEVR